MSNCISTMVVTKKKTMTMADKVPLKSQPKIWEANHKSAPKNKIATNQDCNLCWIEFLYIFFVNVNQMMYVSRFTLKAELVSMYITLPRGFVLTVESVWLLPCFASFYFYTFLSYWKILFKKLYILFVALAWIYYFLYDLSIRFT